MPSLIHISGGSFQGDHISQF